MAKVNKPAPVETKPEVQPTTVVETEVNNIEVVTPTEVIVETPAPVEGETPTLVETPVEGDSVEGDSVEGDSVEGDSVEEVPADKLITLLQQNNFFRNERFGSHLAKGTKTSDEDLEAFYNEYKLSGCQSEISHYEILNLLKNKFKK